MQDGAAGATGAWNIHVFFVWFWQARKYLLSSSEWQASVRSVKLRSAILCTGVFLFYIKRLLMSGNEFACSLGSSSAENRLGVNTKTRWKTLANNARRYSSRCVRAFRHTCTIIMLSNQHLDMPHVWGGWIIWAKKKCSLTQICEQYLREIRLLCT